jgi:hypothetical protein
MAATPSPDVDALPRIDVHEVDLSTNPAAAWEVLRTAVGSTFLLGPQGFPDREETPPRLLRLRGSHAFSIYELRFEVEALEGGERTRVRAVTSAAFPGRLGSMYRALVIGSGAHAVVVRRFLDRLGELRIA